METKDDANWVDVDFCAKSLYSPEIVRDWKKPQWGDPRFGSDRLDRKSTFNFYLYILKAVTLGIIMFDKNCKV